MPVSTATKILNLGHRFNAYYATLEAHRGDGDQGWNAALLKGRPLLTELRVLASIVERMSNVPGRSRPIIDQMMVTSDAMTDMGYQLEDILNGQVEMTRERICGQMYTNAIRLNALRLVPQRDSAPKPRVPVMYTDSISNQGVAQPDPEDKMD